MQKLPSLSAKDVRCSKNIFLKILHPYLLINASHFRPSRGEIMTLTLAILKRKRSSWALQRRAIHDIIVVVVVVICLQFCMGDAVGGGRWAVGGAGKL